MNNEEQREFTTSDAIVQELVRAGVSVAFGIVSIHNIPIYDAIQREGSIQLVCARGESGAVNMADGYARATGKLGVVITSTGTGAGNAAGSLVETWSAGVPLLHLTGEVASPYLGTGRGYIHECKDQLAMMEACCKRAYLLRRPDQTVPLIRQAIREAFATPAGPVTVEIPIDYQMGIIPRTEIAEPVEQTLQQVTPLPEVVIEKIAKAKRPVIWAGGGVITSGASAEVTRLAELIGAAVITSQSGRGAIAEDHPLCVGNFSTAPDVTALLKSSDLLISIGVRFKANETSFWKVEVPKEHIGIDADWQAFNRNYSMTHGLVGDAKKIIGQVANQITKDESLTKQQYRDEVKTLREVVRGQIRSVLGPYEAFLDGMQKTLPRNAIVVRDVTVQASLWGNKLLETYEPRTAIHAAGGGIGQGLPLAIGVQMGQMDKVVVLMAGDGGFMVNLGELATVIQENLPLVIVLFDDAGYGVLRNVQDAAYGRRVAVDLVSPDFALLGRSVGLESVRVGSGEEFARQFEQAVVSRKPSLIVVDMQAVGPLPRSNSNPKGLRDAYSPKKFQ